MNKISKILIVTFALLIVGAIGMVGYWTFGQKGAVICDPSDTKCLQTEAKKATTSNEATSEEPLSNCDINDKACLDAHGEETVDCAPDDPDPACVDVEE